MFRRLLAAAVVMLVTACGRTPSPDVRFVGSSPPTAVEVRGLPSRDIAALAAGSPTVAHWRRILKVTVRESPIPIAGEYSASDGVIRFTPMYGFESWRNYAVTFDATQIPGADQDEAWRRPAVSRVFTFAGTSKGVPTYVKQVYPSGTELPENMLRFYVEFSASMGRAPALEHIRLIDQDGNHVMDPFLPVEAEFWTPDRTRFTLFFDPGRVKRGIKPNRDAGRALIPGRKYALVIGEAWRDGNGQPLQSAHRHEFTVGKAIEKPLDPEDWKVTPPRAGTRDPLTVSFPWPLDHGLLQRSLGVLRGPAEFPGDVVVNHGETRWSFTPRDSWTAGHYSVLALTLLEDPAGNRLGRAFEVTAPVTDSRPSIELSFTVK